MLLMMIAIGSVIGIVVARRVEMTGMPQLVAALHTFVGLAAVFIGINSDLAPPEGLVGAAKIIHEVEIFLGVFIGAVTTTGSVVAFGKLAGIVDGKPLTLPGRNILNLIAVLGCVWLGAMYLNRRPVDALSDDRHRAGLRRPSGAGHRRATCRLCLDAEFLFGMGGRSDRLFLAMTSIVTGALVAPPVRSRPTPCAA